MDRRQLWRHVRRAWVALGFGATIVFVGWSLMAYRASAAAHDAARPDAAVDIRRTDGIRSFLPPAPPATNMPAFIFFPGALVDPVAYAPLLRAAAVAGFPAYIIELPRRGAFGGADGPVPGQRLDRLLAQMTQRRWLVAGHSRGAVVASQVAAEQRPGFAGLVLIGTSHPRDVDLSGVAVPVTKVVGTHDGLASPAEVYANRPLLPAATNWVWIEGGNHSQFASYGFQPGDRRATIAAATQRAEMIRAVLGALSNVAAGAPGS
ncbi:MAG: hypothetical protein H7066_08680 [Cytophagaceae bacterium]|nr:hypothetical protein [Gemmatimonadaceae bacterium]